MTEKDNLELLYIYEQSLLKSCTSKLLDSSNEVIHDNMLSVFDNIDEITRTIYRYLTKERIITQDKVNKIKKENLYEELDSMLLRINE